MTMIQYSNGKSIRTVSLHITDWYHLLEVADLKANEQDQRILDALRYALANGDQGPEQIEGD